MSHSVCLMWRISHGGLRSARSTLDIDLLIPAESLEAVLSVARALGYTFEAGTMRFAGGDIEIRRITKIDSESGDVLALDLLLVNAVIRAVWDTRVQIEWEGGKLWVLSREGLLTLKSLRGSDQDAADIRRLRESENES